MADQLGHSALNRTNTTVVPFTAQRLSQEVLEAEKTGSRGFRKRHKKRMKKYDPGGVGLN
jgi:hypothetical protein